MEAAVVELQGPSTEALTLQSIERVLAAGHPLLVAWSSGKDSSELANLVLTAAAKLARQGIKTPVVFNHSNTLVENPVIVAHARAEIRKIEAFMRRHGIVGSVNVGSPSLSQSWAVRVIGGRALPPFPDTRRDCSDDWKVKVGERTLRLVMKGLAGKGYADPVVCTGVRLDESAERAAAIRARGERSDRIWSNAEGRLMLSPILEWGIDDIWWYVGMCNAGVIDSYSDFADVMRVYRDGGGTSCAVVSDMAMAKFSKPCSSRFGCWTCTAVAKDKSLVNMIESDEAQYGYLRPLSRLRDFIADTQYDWDRRHFVQRTIKDGYINVSADTYSPAMLRELLRYTLTAQCDSGVEIVTEAMLVAIDARWSLYALNPPFEAIRIWIDVMERGARYYPPELEQPFPKTEVPVLGKIFVGKDWDDEASPMYADGLRHPVWEMFSESCGPGLRTFNNGKVGLDLDEGMEIDDEGASDFMCFMAHEKAAEPITPRTRWIEGYYFYLALGTVCPAKGQSSTVDSLLRRANWRQDVNLHGDRTRDELRARCDVRAPLQADLF
jgi:3'-phosphoadenosine 5'-phosphosulfate sulfotransferase (PAPS reductase)/FAD synthetase